MSDLIRNSIQRWLGIQFTLLARLRVHSSGRSTKRKLTTSTSECSEQTAVVMDEAEMKQGECNSHKVKISGDGAKMSRISSYIVMSFALLADKKEVMPVKGNHAFAIVCGKECYENIRESFQKTFDEINELIQAGEIEVEEKTIKLEFFLGGDYKFLLLILGMNAANSNYSCIYCKIHKDQRWDMSKPESFYWYSKNMQRKLEENKKLCKNKKDNYGCINSPLLNIPIENVKVDELHLLLRITDVLERNIIITAIQRDLHEDKNKKSNESKGLHLQNVVKAINSCGVTFSVWEKLDGNGKKTSKHEWTSLVGDEKKKLLRTLPQKFDEVLKPETCAIVKQIWQDFEKLYNIITDWTPTQQQKDSFFGQFVPTPLFENVKTLIENPAFNQSLCFVGAKGVGKSTMLRALYARANFEDESKAFFDLLNPCDVTRLVEKVEGLQVNAHKRTKGWKSSLLFIDNLHKAPLTNVLVSMVNMFVKQPNTYSWLARLICATSRDGLIRLKDAPDIRLNSNDFHVTVVNPVQIVAEKIITRAENTLLTQHTAETVTFLKYFGFVPGIATKFVRYLKVPGGGSRTLEHEIEKFKINQSAALRQIMTDDISENKNLSDAYTQAIVLCMVDGLTPYQLSDWYFLVKEWLAWTFLKQEEELGKITAVSPFSVEVVRDLLAKDDATLMNTLRFIKACNAEGEGVVRGRAFEKLVAWALAKAPVKKLMLVNHTETPEEIDVLPKTITKTQERTGGLPSDFTPEGNACYVFKGAEGVDIILSIETEVYFIQCTVSKTLVSSKKSFWKTAREGWKCVLLTPYDAADLKDHFKKYKSDLGTDFKNGKFYVSDASSILSAAEIEAVKGDIKL